MKPRPKRETLYPELARFTKDLARYMPEDAISEWLASKGYPRYLYKYLPSSLEDHKLKCLLLDSDFYLSSPSSFNDPFDTSAQFEYVRDTKREADRFMEILKKNRPDMGRQERRAEVNRWIKNPESKSLVRKALQTNLETVGVTCFTNDPGNILMWSHYAEKHAGLVVQFEIAKDPETLMAAIPMLYADDYPIYDFNISDSEQFRKILLGKSNQWRYEQESRIIGIGDANTFLPFKPKAITGLIFGCRSSDQYKLKIAEIMGERAAITTSSPEIFQASTDSKSYRIVIRNQSTGAIFPYTQVSDPEDIREHLGV